MNAFVCNNMKNEEVRIKRERTAKGMAGAAARSRVFGNIYPNLGGNVKKSLIVLFVLLMSVSLMAQIRTGNIYGKVTDTEGTALPGVTVTLSARILAPVTAITSEMGAFRFPALGPGNDYNLSAELTGFKKASKSGIIVAIGVSVEINLVLEIGKLEEEVTVVAVTPVVDAKKTTQATNVTRTELQSLPSGRDPWVILGMAPGVLLDRQNVGGSESGSQSGFVAKGDSTQYQGIQPGGNNLWTMDGIDIGDPAAIGSTSYYDFDTFEEMNITTGGSDVSLQTGGVAVNLVTRRGGNRTNLAGRFYLTDNYFQGTNITAEITAAGLKEAKIQQIKDYGVNAGGPIIKDKLWWWAGYGVNDIFTYGITGAKNQGSFNNYNMKLNAQIIPDNRLEAQVISGGKELYGRNAGVAKDVGDHQTGKYHWGSPIIKIQDEHVFGSNFFVALKYSFNDTGFKWAPINDETFSKAVIYDVNTTKYTNGTWGGYFASRPRNNYQATATYFNDSLFGVSHEIRAGVEMSNKQASHQWGNFQDFQININYATAQIDLTGDGVKDKIPATWKRFSFNRAGMDGKSTVDQIAGYFSDTITAGNFTFLLGLRYDRQSPSSGAFTLPAVLVGSASWNAAVESSFQTTLDQLLPGIDVQEVKSNVIWNTWSPRLGLTWDATGDGKTIAKLSVAQYGDVMTTSYGSLAAPLGLAGSMLFWWKDANGNGIFTSDEAYWLYPSTHALKNQAYNVFTGGVFTANWALGKTAGMYAGYDPLNPTDLDYTTQVYTFDKKSSSKTQELIISLERELLPDFGAAAIFSMRKFTDWENWVSYYPDTGEMIDSPDWYVSAGTIPATVGGHSTGGAAGRNWYVLGPRYDELGPTDYSYIKSSGSAYTTWWGLDLVLTKRLSNKWMMSANATFSGNKGYWGDSYTDPTNKWAFDGQPYMSAQGSLSGKPYDVQMYSTWMFKIGGLYQLPWDFNLSGFFSAREGYRVAHYFWITDSNLSGLDTWAQVYTQPTNNDKLDPFYELTLRLEKMVKVGEGRLYFMADMFNVLNSAHIIATYNAYLGDYDVANDDWWENPTNRQVGSFLNPRIIRLGVRFEF